MGHWLADLHLAGFAPEFTLSQGDSECSRKSTNANSIGRYWQVKRKDKFTIKYQTKFKIYNYGREQSRIKCMVLKNMGCRCILYRIFPCRTLCIMEKLNN